MARYCFVCKECGEREEHQSREPVLCCGVSMHRDWQKERAGGPPPFRAYWSETFKGIDPTYVKTKKQEQKLCKEHGFERVK